MYIYKLECRCMRYALSIVLGQDASQHDMHAGNYRAEGKVVYAANMICGQRRAKQVSTIMECYDQQHSIRTGCKLTRHARREL
jgi:hypothetical protein